MTDDPHVFEVGRLDDGGVAVPLAVGVSRGTVTIGGGAMRWTLTEAGCEEFSQYFVRAQWLAARYRDGAP